MKPQHSAVVYKPTRYDKELYSHSCSLHRLEMEENELNEWKAQNPQHSQDHPMLLCLQEGVQITLSEVNTTSQWVLREWRRITSEQDKQRSQKRWYSVRTLWGLLTTSRGEQVGTSSTLEPNEQREGRSTTSITDMMRSISATQHWTLQREKKLWQSGDSPQSDGTEHELLQLEDDVERARAAYKDTADAMNELAIMLGMGRCLDIMSNTVLGISPTPSRRNSQLHGVSHTVAHSVIISL